MLQAIALALRDIAPFGRNGVYAESVIRNFGGKERRNIRMVTRMVTTRFNERWIVLGDIRNSARFFYLLDKHTNHKTEGNELLFKVTSMLNLAIECIYQIVEQAKPEKASLGNTMGDGFLVIGFAGHGSPHIAYEFADMLRMCKRVKREADRILAETKGKILEEIEEVMEPGDGVLLPDLELKLCVHSGYVLTSVGFNRYIGDSINRCARVISSAFEEKQTNAIVLTDDYFQLLPRDLGEIASGQCLSEEIRLRNYFERGESDSVTIWRIPFDYETFWETVKDYLRYYDPTKDMGYLAKKLYSRGKENIDTVKTSDNKA